MNDDQLRDRIARSDPLLGAAEPPSISSPSSRAFLEDIMNTSLDTRPAMDDPAPVGRRPDRRWLAVVGAAAAVAAIVVGLGATAGWFDGGGDTEVAEPTVLELSTGSADPALMSCIQIEPQLVADQQVAFRGIVESIDGDRVTLRVDRWYVGGDADVVAITSPLGLEALIGSVDWVVGEPFLVGAYDGVVNYCGFSGPATPELQSIYDQAFPG